MKSVLTRAIREIAEALGVPQMESYVLGPKGVGVVRLDISNQISAYLSFSYFPKHCVLGTYVGFAFPGLKAVTDKCLLSVGRKLGNVPKGSVSNPCPAVLFPLEFYLPASDSQLLKIPTANAGEWTRKLLQEELLRGWCSRIVQRQDLCTFLASNEAPFAWGAAEVPRRLVHVAFLAHEGQQPLEEATKLVAPARESLQGDADFVGCSGERLVEAVLQYFFLGTSC